MMFSLMEGFYLTPRLLLNEHLDPRWTVRRNVTMTPDTLSALMKMLA